MEGGKGRVCVTGGTGFIASWLIMRLLQQGYSVNATIRDGKKDVSFLTGLPGARENLKFFTADLSDPESFVPAIEGCIGVFHMATPVDFEDKEPEAVVTSRAIDGTVGVLKACLKSKTLKKMVNTSSVSAVFIVNNDDVDTVDESFWSDVDFLRANRPFAGSYSISKTLTEKAAFEFAAQHGLDLVTVIPSFVVGPFICPKLPASVASVLAPIVGKWDVHSDLDKLFMVHVDDVARAHVFLLEYPDANGRYICSFETMTVKEIAEFLASKYPEYPIAPLPEIKQKRTPSLSSKKLLDTGFQYECSINDMFDDAVKCCKEKGYL